MRHKPSNYFWVITDYLLHLGCITNLSRGGSVIRTAELVIERVEKLQLVAPSVMRMAP